MELIYVSLVVFAVGMACVLFRLREVQSLLRVKNEEAFNAWWAGLAVDESRLIQVIVLKQGQPLAYGDEKLFVVVYDKQVQKSKFAFLPRPRSRSEPIECHIGDFQKMIVSIGAEDSNLRVVFQVMDDGTPHEYPSNVTCIEVGDKYLILVQDAFEAMRHAVLLEETKGTYFEELVDRQKTDAKKMRTVN